MESIVPVATLPPATPFTDHVSGLVITDAVNCCVAPARTSAVVGEMVKASDPPEVPGAKEQLAVISASATTIVAAMNERPTVPPLVTRRFQMPVQTLYAG